MKRWKEKENRCQQTGAFIAAALVNAFGSSQSVDATDLLPFPPPPRHMTVEESVAALRAFAVSTGATIVEKKLDGDN